MTNFQPGDRVRAVHTHNTDLDPDRVYTVARVEPSKFGGQYLTLEEYQERFRLRSTRFEHFTFSLPTMEPGDQVVCVDAANHMGLTHGLIYTVSDEEAELDNMFYVEGVQEAVLRERFVPHLTSGEALEEFERPAREAYEEKLGEYVAGSRERAKGQMTGSVQDDHEESDFMKRVLEYSENNDYAAMGIEPDVATYLRRYEEYGSPVTTHLLPDGPFCDISDVVVLGVEAGNYEDFMTALHHLRRHALAQFEVKRDRGGFQHVPEPKDLVDELWQVVFGYERPEEEAPKQTWENLLEHLTDLLGPGGLHQWRENLDNAQRSVEEAQEQMGKRDEFMDQLQRNFEAREKHLIDANVELHERLRSLALYAGTAAYGDHFVLNNSDDMVKVLKDAFDQLIGSDD